MGAIAVDPIVGALLGAAAGWALNEFSSWIRVRREDRRASGRALAHILETERQLSF